MTPELAQSYAIYIVARYLLVTYWAIWAGVLASGFLGGMAFAAALFARDQARRSVHALLRITREDNPFLGITPPSKPDWYTEPEPPTFGLGDEVIPWTGERRWRIAMKQREQFVSENL